MGRPKKSALNAFVDLFCEMTLDQQEKALDLMQFENRRAQIRAKKETSRLEGQPPKLDVALFQNAIDEIRAKKEPKQEQQEIALREAES